VFQIEKTSLVEFECFVNVQLTIHCEIEYFIPNRYEPYEVSGKSPTQPDLHKKPFNNSDQLNVQQEEFSETMTFSDFTI
jgi:hypothetical protein